MTSWQPIGPAEWRNGVYRITRFTLPSDAERHYIWSGRHLLTSCLSMDEAQAWIARHEADAVEARSVQGGSASGLQAVSDVQGLPVDPGPACTVPEVP